MFKLDYRKVTDDVNLQPHIEANPACGNPRIPASEIPIQFMMINESICEDNVRAAEKDFLLENSETRDREMLKSIIPDDLGWRLSKL